MVKRNFAPAQTEHEITAYNSITLTFHLYEMIIEQNNHFRSTECRMEETGQALHNGPRNGWHVSKKILRLGITWLGD